MKAYRKIPTYCGRLIIAAALAVLLAAPLARAATNTWLPTGGTNDWFEPTNWSGGNVPTNGDDAVINPGATTNWVMLTNSTYALASILLTNKCTLIFSNWDSKLSATNVDIYSNATVSHVVNTASNDPWNPEGRVWIACSNLLVAAGASINANGKGYGSQQLNYTFGYGPGGGAPSAGGGSYGGPGGAPDQQSYLYYYTNRPCYGSAYAPDLPGSGGGQRNSPYPGTNGGGAIRIEATGVVTVNGTISANGVAANGGGGSGGAVHITCLRLAGTNGTVSANGGASYSYSGGGGGRIAIDYNPGVQTSSPLPSVRFSAAGGMGYYYSGKIGTLYFSNNFFLTESISHSGWWFAPGFSNWSVSSLTISNAWIGFPSNGFSLTITNNLLVQGTNPYLHGLELTNATLTCQGSVTLSNAALQFLADDSESSPSPLSVNFGSLSLTNGARFYVYSLATNAAGPDYGTLVNITGDVIIGGSSWIIPVSHPTNIGGSALFVMSNLTISSTNGGFNASAAGFKGYGFAIETYDGASDTSYGPGRGLPGGGTGNGAGYGGKGGGYTANTNYGKAYGSSNYPVDQGSGGGMSWLPSTGGRGGGVVRIRVASTLTLNGIINANGRNGINQDGGGGAGGGVYITCRDFAGSGGTLSANGGTGGSRYGGGGGRIALWRMYHSATGATSTSVSGGACVGTGGNGEAGTVVWGWIPVPGTVFTIH